MIDPSNFFDKEGKWKAAGSDMIHQNHIAREQHFDGFWQPCFIYNREIKLGRKKTEPVAFNFTCGTIFTDKEEAAAFLPYYLKQLITQGDLPKDVIKEDKTIDETKLIPTVAHLEIGQLERAD